MGYWRNEPEQHDYPAALQYLCLIMPALAAEVLVDKLQAAEMTTFKAKDIYRASRLPLLGLSNSHVRQNTKKIKKGIKLSPILLIRLEHRLVIADGYHRLCAVYAESEDELIPCKIVG